MLLPHRPSPQAGPVVREKDATQFQMIARLAPAGLRTSPTWYQPDLCGPSPRGAGNIHQELVAINARAHGPSASLRHGTPFARRDMEDDADPSQPHRPQKISKATAGISGRLQMDFGVLSSTS